MEKENDTKVSNTRNTRLGKRVGVAMRALSWRKIRLLLLTLSLTVAVSGLSGILLGGLFLQIAGWVGLMVGLALIVVALTVNYDAGRAVRRERHELVNHLQVVSGLIQMGKEQQALEYIQKMAIHGDKSYGQVVSPN